MSRSKKGQEEHREVRKLANGYKNKDYEVEGDLQQFFRVLLRRE
jgi:hypothetical protein